MQEIYIVNYCNPNCSPLKSITRLSKAEAFEKAKDLSDKYIGTAFGRFADFKNYYSNRIQAEDWLYKWFKKLGGEPDTKHPLYFVLQGSDYLNHWFGKGTVTKIPLSGICSKHISFTFGDSVSKFKKKERKNPFLIDELISFINLFNGDVKKFISSIEEEYTYIEAQLWNDGYFHK